MVRGCGSSDFGSASRCGGSVAWSAPDRRIREVFQTLIRKSLHKEVEVAMNGFSISRVVVVMALMATISVGCAASRGGGCHGGRCRVSSGAGSVPPRRSDVVQAHATDEAPRGKVQQVCPVTGEKLGSMGPPISVTVGGKSIQVCCNSCVAAVKKNPEKYLKIVADEVAVSDTSAVRREAFYDRTADAGRVSRSSASHHH